MNTDCAEKFQFASTYRLEVTAASGEREEVDYGVMEEEIGDKVFRYYLAGLTPNSAFQVNISKCPINATFDQQTFFINYNEYNYRFVCQE